MQNPDAPKSPRQWQRRFPLPQAIASAAMAAIARPMYGGAVLLGMSYQRLCDAAGVLAGQEAVAYYAEVHTHPCNVAIHAVLMPVATYYFFLGVPAMLRIGVAGAATLRNCIYWVLLTHYAAAISVVGAARVLPVYLPVLALANSTYATEHGRLARLARRCLARAAAVMLFAEAVGHTVFESVQSRPGGVPNAILFSAYFAANGR